MSLLGWMLLATLPWMAVLCVKDWRTRRLPNVWVLPMGAVALMVRLASAGWSEGVLPGLTGGALCGLFLLLPFFLRMAGAGDVKLLAVCGCWLGSAWTATFLMLTSLGGFVLAVTFLLCRQGSAARLMHLFRTLTDVRYDRATGRAQLPPRTDESGRIPFSLAIAFGYLGTLGLAGGLI